MTILDQQPQSTNLQSPLNFVFNIARTPSINYQCQEVNVPQIILPPAKTPTPFIGIPFPGDHINFSPLTITFKVDDLLQNWLEIFNWMNGLGNPDATATVFNQLQSNPSYSPYGEVSDIRLMNLNSQKNPTYVFTFEKAWPTSLSGLSFTSKDPSLNYMTASVTFMYLKYSLSYP